MEIAGAQSAYRLLDVLTEVALHPDGMSAAEVAQAMDLTAPTAHRLLRVLCDRGFAVQAVSGGKFRPGPQIRLLAGDAMDPERLAELARGPLTRLRDVTNETGVPFGPEPAFS